MTRKENAFKWFVIAYYEIDDDTEGGLTVEELYKLFETEWSYHGDENSGYFGKKQVERLLREVKWYQKKMKVNFK